MSIALSVIIPAYNAEAFIGRTLSSLLTQMDSGVEILVVNDGSTDNTAKAVEEIISGSPGARVALLSKPNGGVSSARNWGLDKAQGAFVFFLDADDWAAEGFVARLLKEIRGTQADIIHWPYDLVGVEGETLQRFPYTDPVPLKRPGLAALEAILLGKTTRICTGSAAYRKSLLTDYQIRYTEGCTAGEDLEFAYKGLTHAGEVLFSPHIRSMYLQHPASVMNTYSVKKFSAIGALQRVRDVFLSKQSPGFQTLARHMDDFDIPHSYAGTYAMCLRHLMDAEKLRPGAAVKRLDGEIDALFPGLGGQIKQMLAKRPRKALPDKLDLFRLSPLLYARLSGLRQVGNG